MSVCASFGLADRFRLDKLPEAIQADIYARATQPRHDPFPSYQRHGGRHFVAGWHLRRLPPRTAYTLIARGTADPARRALYAWLRVGRSPEADEALTALLEAKPSIACLVRRLDVQLEGMNRDGVKRVAHIITAARGLAALAIVSVAAEVIREAREAPELGALARAATEALAGRSLRMLSIPALAPADSVAYDHMRQLVLKSRPVELRLTVVSGWDSGADSRSVNIEGGKFVTDMGQASQIITVDGRLDDELLNDLTDEIVGKIVYVRATIYMDGEPRALPLARCKNLRRLDLAGLNFSLEEDYTLPDSLQTLQLAHPMDGTRGIESVERLGRMLAQDRMCPQLRELELLLDEYDVYNDMFDDLISWRSYALEPRHEAALAEVRRHCARRGIELDIALPAE